MSAERSRIYDPTRPRRSGRRRFLKACLFGAPAVAVAADAWCVEPGWLEIRRINVARGTPTHRIVQFSDVHFRGDAAYFKEVIATVNSFAADFVCFTGDIVEQGQYLEEALEIMSAVKAPMYGVPGNWEYWSMPGGEVLRNGPHRNLDDLEPVAKAYFAPIRKMFEATGGRWIEDADTLTKDGKVNILGATARKIPDLKPKPGVKNLFLVHYPAWSRYWLPEMRFDLTLSGHSHGGQVRLPFLGALRVPDLVDEYSQGLFPTKFGPLYVNAGIGYSHLNVRFLCRPEITVIEF